MDGGAAEGRLEGGDVRRWRVSLTVEGDDGASLLRLASVFHRRRIPILEASYSRRGIETWMTATVETTEQRLRTLALTLRNTVGVTGHRLALDNDRAKELR